MAYAKQLLRPSLVLGALCFVIHLVANGRYGFGRDELYFIVCGRHLDWGYVDQPPLIPLLAAASYQLFGELLTGFRLVPAIAMAATVALTAEFARAIGGSRFAQGLAGLCVLAAPHFLAIGLLFTTDTFQALGWLCCFWCVVRIEQTRDERWWLVLGAIAGVTLQGKYMIGFFLVALAVGLVMTPLRRSLAKPWVYGGVAIAAAIILPNLLWQWSHHWPFWELGEAAKHGKNVALSPWSYIGQQILIMGPLAAVVWMSGLWASAVKPKFAALRALPICYVLLVALFVANHGKPYYLSSIYLILFAVGSVAIEGWVRNVPARTALTASIAVLGLVSAPLAIPVFTEEGTIRYASALGMGPSTTATETSAQARLPQHFADMHGWPQVAAKVAAAYRTLTPAERRHAAFYGSNYGRAAAIDVFGAQYGLPPAIGSHNNYWLWGPRQADGSVIIEIGGTREDHLKDFASVELAGELDDPYAMPYETNQPIWIERGLKKPLAQAWPRIRHYD